MSRPKLLLIIWFISDLILFQVAFAFAYFLRVGFILSSDFPFNKFILITSAIAPLWLLVLSTTRTFSFTRSQQTIRNTAYIGYSVLVGVALFSLGYYFTYEAFFSRLLLVYAFAITAIGVLVWHILYSKIIRSALRSNPPSFPTLIIGLTRESKKLIETLNAKKNPLVPVAILDGRGTKEKEVDGVPVLGKLNKLEDVLEEKKITHLIQCSDLEQSINLLSACRSKSITYMLLPSVLGIVERDEKIDSLEGLPVTTVKPNKK
ncbi:hypothetical protein HN512_03200 [Candidatus Peregrinibacteria bacterium]|jgi:FlaA1/EpsC-like NDP-sugar epimerase|nr:hypothetical protein [Candidatus Peregrinibacteria bacterium]MBT3598820.1 hypothetical protein [Candidatus Peregrinibacteria bacterium]MBT4367208.1 hypothetical protein [Candidatus Peregrinibacteria bacterium]MBT4585398.1 hypothetical protein [Candidatus Peregrinibacteria bacterium]MBT7009210.1 hypothetical protein [Candidatus Peregrinibacteria bacterium]